jgi:hypothetical protein
LRSWRTRSLPALLLVAVVAACGGGATTGPAPIAAPAPAAGPAEVVERFLRLAASRSYLQMGQLFGTLEGPITNRDPASQVERRMYAIADILQNERFVVRGQQAIPGRGAEATQLTVQITRHGETKDVPFVAVHTNGGLWLVEQVDLQALTRVQ